VATSAARKVPLKRETPLQVKVFVANYSLRRLGVITCTAILIQGATRFTFKNFDHQRSTDQKYEYHND